MTWLGILLWVIMNIPNFIKIIEAIIDMLKSFPLSRRKSVRLMISDAIRTDDKEHVENVIGMAHGALLAEYPKMISSKV